MKKIARAALRAGQHFLPPENGGVLILCYHLVGGGTSSPVDLPMDAFREQMRQLSESGSVVSIDEAIQSLQEGRRDTQVVLTFDDAYANFAEKAYPVLDEFRLPSTLCVPVGFLEGTSPPPISGTDLPPVSWEALDELVAAGRLTICGHSWTHPDLRTLPPDQDDLELRQAREILEQRLHTEVRGFCYPRARRSDSAERRVKDHYAWALVGGGRRLTPDAWHPLRLQRVSLRRDMPTDLSTMLRARLWLEEWVADRVRRLL